MSETEVDELVKAFQENDYAIVRGGKGKGKGKAAPQSGWGRCKVGCRSAAS